MGMRAALLEWYRPRTSLYPWRTDPPDPYRVLVSEIMLQQTQASRVVPMFESFVSRFPTIGSLAAAPKGVVLRAWSGLGYNRRAVALSDAARIVMAAHDGTIPDDPASLIRLPGVGPYTAAAVASIGFGLPVAAIDTNTRRVVSRAILGLQPAVARSRDVNAAARRWLDRSAPGRWNQAVMDLGREVCRPLPRCEVCPLSSGCRFPSVPRRAAQRTSRRQAFAGSSRQVRGAILRALVGRSPATLASLVRTTGFDREPVAVAIRALHRDGLVVAAPEALTDQPKGKVRLPD
jgi:A/G-specific adenine glycosylase